jgi:hypothetical protein
LKVEKSPARRRLAAEITRFASENAGTSLDLDQDLEKAGLDHLNQAERRRAKKPEPIPLVKECASLDPSEECQLAQEDLAADLSWPEY